MRAEEFQADRQSLQGILPPDPWVHQILPIREHWPRPRRLPGDQPLKEEVAMKKLLLASVIAIASAAAMIGPANAGRIQLGIGIGDGGYYDDYYGGYRPYYRDYYDDRYVYRPHYRYDPYDNGYRPRYYYRHHHRNCWYERHWRHHHRIVVRICRY